MSQLRCRSMGRAAAHPYRLMEGRDMLRRVPIFSDQTGYPTPCRIDGISALQVPVPLA